MNKDLDRTSNYVITIGRQFGSGGRELGRELAARFGIEYYDKKLLLEAASRAGMSPEVFERNDERMPNLLGSSVGFNMGYGQLPWYNGQTMMTDSIYSSLTDVIEHLADTRPCVIVGRSADYVLRNHPAARVNLFVHAPIEERVKRIMGRADKDKEGAARTLAVKTDKLRAAYYNFYTDKKWGDSASYDLTFDSSLMPIGDLCDLVAFYIRCRFGIEPVRK
ncbi:MAG: cytidylate kinase-like family protein [Muribaculaceae bacterium]|nr:cytidylate kinase-like family protein [Muribaculaceae bacterium]